MSVNALIAQGVRPIGADLPEIGNMLHQRRAQDAETARRNELMDMARQREQAATQQQLADEERAFLGNAVEILSASAADPQRFAATRQQFLADPRTMGVLAKLNVTPEQVTPENVLQVADQIRMAQGIEAPAPKAQMSQATSIQEYEAAKATGFTGSYLDFERAKAQATRAPQQGTLPKPTPVGQPQKPLPVGALRLVTDARQAITSSSESLALLDRALAKLRGDPEKGVAPVELGAVDNVVSRTRNYLGKSTDNSRAFADIQQTLEKLRNNYLLLAKGVQTEGDAQRAWNSEIGESVANDSALAIQQLEKARGMIERAIEAQNANIESVYANFGAQPPVASQGEVIEVDW